jgi:DNA-binding NarL/FixJ family response regulator
MLGTTTIVLADDHQVVRQGLRALLESEPGFSVVGEASDGLRVAGVVERLRPDVLVADLMMPGLGGLEVTRQVTRRFPKTRVVILSMHASEAYVVEALRNGASAYVLKDADASQLVRAIREAAAGRRCLSAPFSAQALDSYLRKAREAAADLYETLTSREREVLHLTAEGLTSAGIARRLGISPRTAESHRANILRKLGLRGQTDLIRYTLSRGILPLGAEPARPPRGRGQPHKNP